MKYRLLTLLLLLLSLTSAAQQDVKIYPDRPKLVLLIMIDNLNTQQIEIVRNQCATKGFNRIFANGARLTDAYYDAGGNFVGKNLATLFTGAPASTHGIVGKQWIDSFTGNKIDAIYGEVPSSGRFDTLAVPHNGALLCGTVANEIRKVYNDKAKVFSVGFDPEMLIWTSGTKAGEPFLWLDRRNGQVRCANVADTTTLGWVKNFNDKKIPDVYKTKTWAPRKDITDYHQSRFFPEVKSSAFFYSLAKTNAKGERYAAVCGSPYGNDLIRDLAASALIFEDMGKDDIPDIMTVQFNATPSLGAKRQPLDPETEDLLLGLDDNIASLLQVVDQSIGMDNTLVIFTAARGAFDVAATDSPQWSERGRVSLQKASALLNLYLMALYGQARWVKNYAPGCIYLDREVADKKGVNYDSLMMRSCQFLTQVKGIGDAFPAAHLRDIVSASPVVEAMRNNYHPKRSGDILIHLEPGWAEELDNGQCLTQLWSGEFVPLVFYGWKIPRTIVYDPHNMADLAPTLCSFIGVARPDACSGQPIRLRVGE